MDTSKYTKNSTLGKGCQNRFGRARSQSQGNGALDKDPTGAYNSWGHGGRPNDGPNLQGTHSASSTRRKG